MRTPLILGIVVLLIFSVISLISPSGAQTSQTQTPITGHIVLFQLDPSTSVAIYGGDWTYGVGVKEYGGKTNFSETISLPSTVCSVKVNCGYYYLTEYESFPNTYHVKKLSFFQGTYENLGNFFYRVECNPPSSLPSKSIVGHVSVSYVCTPGGVYVGEVTYITQKGGCTKGVAKLSDNQFKGNHNCDDNPQACCPAGYRMCTESELNQYFAMGCIDFDSYGQWGWYISEYNPNANCNGWTLNSGGQGADARIIAEQDKYVLDSFTKERRYSGFIPALYKGSAGKAEVYRCSSGRKGVSLDAKWPGSYDWWCRDRKGPTCNTYRKVWCCPD